MKYSREQVESIEVGSLVPTVFGHRKVSRIVHKGEDRDGYLFAVVYVWLRENDGATMSESISERAPVRYLDGAPVSFDPES